jgi:hypothetical protein
MMFRFHRSGRAAARAIAILGAALILVSTSIGVAHFHDGAIPRDGKVVAQIGADAGVCPVCQLALHSPVSLAAATVVARGPIVAETIFVAAPILPEPAAFSTARVRAPPVSL